MGAAGSADLGKGHVQMGTGLGMDTDPVRACSGKVVDIALGGVDHQMDIKDTAALVHQVADTFNDDRPDGDIGNKLAVHHINVDDPDARVHHPFDILSQA